MRSDVGLSDCLVLSVGRRALFFLFFFKQKPAYEMRISDWSSDVCSSDLIGVERRRLHAWIGGRKAAADIDDVDRHRRRDDRGTGALHRLGIGVRGHRLAADVEADAERVGRLARRHQQVGDRSEEHTSELQSLMRISYAVFCLKKKTKK